MNSTTLLFYGFYLPLFNTIPTNFGSEIAAPFTHTPINTFPSLTPKLSKIKSKSESATLLSFYLPITFNSNQLHHRAKRGIIWDTIKKFHSGIWSAKKTLWKIKTKAVEIINGKDDTTPKPHYESTGGSWGTYQQQSPKASLPLLSGVHGPPYHGSASNLNAKGYTANLRSAGWGNNQNQKYNKNSGSSTKLTYADYLAIYTLPMNKRAALLRNLKGWGRFRI